MVRYSFPVGLLHSLLHAGLSRRTDSLSSHTPEFAFWDTRPSPYSKIAALGRFPPCFNRHLEAGVDSIEGTQAGDYSFVA
jgi:hypothetical protein